MPPKAKFTKEEIVNAALDIVRNEGAAALTSRSLGVKLGSSARPIFTVFQSMDEVAREVLLSANELYQSRIEKAMNESAFLPYKASGMAYIQFAKDEKELFKLLFMRDRTGEIISEDHKELFPILEIIMKNLKISEDDAYKLHLEAWIFVHGIATMIATGFLSWDEEYINKALTDVYEGLKHQHTGGK